MDRVKAAEDLDYLLCARDPHYWVSHYGWIKDEEGEIVGPGVDLWPDQIDYFDRYLAGEWLIGGKSRRVGMSWISTLADMHDQLFTSNITISLIAQGQSYSEMHLARHRWLYERQPPHIARHVPVTGYKSKSAFGLSNGSIVLAYPCTGAQGRGAGGKRIRLEEFAQFPDAERVRAAAYGAVRDRGQLVIISTGQGEGGDFHAQWTKAERGESRFKPIFLGWRSRPERPDNFRDGMDALERQEYPETPDEMFLSTGLKFFDQNLLKILADRDQREPEITEMSGCLRIYRPPVAGRQYVIGADVADGGGDACSADVLDLATGEQVAHYNSLVCSADEFGDVLSDIGKAYNWAFIGVERNNMGHATVAVLQRNHYPSLYYHQHYDPDAATTSPRAGWMTDQNSRPVMLGDLRQVIKDPSQLAIHDDGTYRELRAFGWYKGRWDHPPNGFSDRVISLSIAQQMRQAAALMMGRDDIVIYQGDKRIA